MLENEQVTTDRTTESTTDGTVPAKTTRKRTTKKTSAASTAAASAEPTASTADPAEPAKNTATKKSAARKTTAKKTAAAPDSGPTSVEAETTAVATAKKTSRRSTKKTAPLADSPFAAVDPPAAEPSPRASRSSRRGPAPAVLFQAPEPVAAPREADDDRSSAAASAEPTTNRRTRTRSGSRSAGAPDQPTTTAQPDEPATTPDGAAPTAAADPTTASTGRRTRSRSASRASGAPGDTAVDSRAEDAAGSDSGTVDSDRTAAGTDADELTEQTTSSSRRRRRGSRGRGRKPSTPGDESGEAETAEADSDEASTAVATDESQETAESKTSRSSRSRSRSRSSSAKAAAAAAGEDQRPDDERAGDQTDTSSDAEAQADDEQSAEDGGSGTSSSSRRRRRRRRSSDTPPAPSPDDPPLTVVKVRDARPASDDVVTGVSGSTRLEAKKQRRRDGRDQARRRTPVLTEAEFLARRESVDRVMVVRQSTTRTQIAVLEDGILVEHYVTQSSQTSYVGNVYLGRVQNVLPAMEAAFIDIGKGRNGVLYAGEVAWSRLGLEGKPKRVESVLSSGSPVLVQVTKDPVAHKGARLTGMVTLPGRFLVYAPGGSMSGISRKLPENERNRLKSILKKVFPDEASVIIRTAAEGASEEELTRDVKQLEAQWNEIEAKLATASAPSQLYAEPDLAIKVVRDMFNEDVTGLVISGDEAWDTLHSYVSGVAPDLLERVTRWDGDQDVFAAYRVDEQIAKALDRKVWLPSGGSLVIDRTEAMTVIDVNTGKFTGSGGSLEETVTKNNLEAAEEIVRQIRLRDVGGIIVIDFIDMVLERNRDLVLRRLVECLGRDRTRHQVAEVTSLGLVQMTRKRVGVGLFEAFSETCEHCQGRGVHVHAEPIEQKVRRDDEGPSIRRDDSTAKKSKSSSGSSKSSKKGKTEAVPGPVPDHTNGRKTTEVIKAIAAAASRAHENGNRPSESSADAAPEAVEVASEEGVAVDGAADDHTLAARDADHAGPEIESIPAAESVDAAGDDAPDDPQAAPTGRPKRRRVTRPAGAPA